MGHKIIRGSDTGQNCIALISVPLLLMGPLLTRNIATPASFPFYVWPWQFMPKMIETGAMIRSMVAKKCRFRRKWDIDSVPVTDHKDAHNPPYGKGIELIR